MRQGLSRTVFIYYSFSSIVFRSFPQTNTVVKIPTIIGIREKTTFGLYMDNSLSLVRIFKDMHEFLHKTYFLQVVLGLVYLIGKKTFTFDDKLDILGF